MSYSDTRVGSRASCSALCMALLICGVAGCMKPTPTAMVKGKVTVKGQQLSKGTVIFYNSSQGSGASCPIDSDGNYQTSEKVFAGSYTVAIGPAASDPILEPGAVGMPPPPVVDSSVPAKYTSIQTSGLTTEIVDGDNTFNVEVP